MKKIIASILILVFVLAGIWLFSISGNSDSHFDFQFIIIIVLAVFALFAIVKRILSYNRKEPAEDEFSKLITQKAASLSYFISLYLWLFLSYFNERIADSPEKLVGYGIILMALSFTAAYIYYMIKGIRNE